MSDTIEEVILKSLYENMGYKTGEKVAIVEQVWSDVLPAETQEDFGRSKEVVDNMYRVLSTLPNVKLFQYKPQKAEHGADATPDLYKAVEAFKPDIIFMPTVFSLTVTNFRLTQCKRGSRLASMPEFTLNLFDPKGPMDIDYHEVKESCEEIAEKLRKSKYVRITAKDTDIKVEINPDLIHRDSGLFVTPGACGNLPAGETYLVPNPDSNGYFTVPKGWGGTKPLEYTCRFTVENGRITKVEGTSAESNSYISNVIEPIIFDGENYNVFAELGIGTNPAITAEYIKQHGWSGLTAEKIINTAHFANGGNKGMGGTNDVQKHIDWVVPNVTIEYIAQ